MQLPFELIVVGPPVSQQTRNRQRLREWMRHVQDMARQGWGTEQPFVGEVKVSITYFFEGASIDVDNMAKPILDAMKDLVFSDDTHVYDLLCRKRDMNTDVRIQEPSSALLDALSDAEQFLQIKVTEAQIQEVPSW